MTTTTAHRATAVAARAMELSKVYGHGETQVVALDRVTVDFPQGEFTAIMGPSGSGKSTLMHCVAGLERVIDMVGLSGRLHHRPAQLSGGQQQRVAVARALASQPEIIFGDEPTGNLDSRSGAEVLGFLRNSVQALGQTVVMVTHDPVAASYADRVVFLADGRIVDEMLAPTADGVLDRMKAFDAKGRTS